MKKPSQSSRQGQEYIFDLAEEGEKRFSDPFMDAVELRSLMDFLTELEVEGISMEAGYDDAKRHRDKFYIHFTYNKKKKKLTIYFGDRGVRMKDGKKDVLLSSLDSLLDIFKQVDNENQRKAQEVLLQKNKKKRIKNLKHTTIESKVKILSKEMDFEYKLYDVSDDLVFNPETKKYQKRNPAMTLSIKLDEKNCLDTEISLDDFQSVLEKLERIIGNVRTLYQQEQPFQVKPQESTNQGGKWKKGK